MRIKDMPENNKEAREEKAELLERAVAVGLTDEASKKEVVSAEHEAKSPNHSHSRYQKEKLPSEHLKIKHMPVPTPELNEKRNRWITRAKAVGLDSRATQQEVVLAESGKTPTQLSNSSTDLVIRARRAGLQDWATEPEIKAAEARVNGNPQPDNRKTNLIQRARLAGLVDEATEEQIIAAEEIKGIDYSNKNLKDKKEKN